MMAVKTVYLAFILSLFELNSAQDIRYNSSEICGTNSGQDAVCLDSDPTHYWNVDLDCKQPNSVRVRFNNYNNTQNLPEFFRREEVLLSCSGLDNNQNEVSIECSATVSGQGAEHDGYVIFNNLTEAGIHPGSRCTFSGCFFYIENGADIYAKTPTATCTLPTDPNLATTTAQPTTMATTTMATTTTATTVTLNDNTTSDTVTSDPVTNSLLHNMTNITVNRNTTPGHLLPSIVVPLIVILILLFATLLSMTIIVVWIKQQRDRKMALLLGDKQIMIFDPTYTPPVSIDKPAKNYYSHRLSFISLDLHHYLQPYGEFTTDLYGSQKLKVDLIDPNGSGVTIEGDNCTVESTGSYGYVIEKFTTPAHNHSATTDNQSELTLKKGNSQVSNYITTTQYGDVLHTTDQDQGLGEDTLSILLAEDTPESTLAVGDINLDQPQSSHDSEYVQSNTAASNALSAFPNESPFELEPEEEPCNGDGHQNLTSVSLSTVSCETTSYLDSQLFGGATSLHHQRDLDDSEECIELDLSDSCTVIDSNLLTRSFDPAVAIPEQEKLTEHQTGNPLTHLTNTEGYVQDTETPPPSYADNESLDLTFDTDSGNDLTFEPNQQSEEELPSHHHDNTTPDLDTPHAPPPSITTPGYVRCEDIITNELSTREIVVPAGLISPSEAAESANFTVHLDFDEGMKSHPNPVELTLGHSNPGMNKVMYKLSTSQPNKQPWQLPKDDTTTFARAIGKEQYVSYDISSAEELSLSDDERYDTNDTRSTTQGDRKEQYVSYDFISSAEELSLSYSPDDPDPMWVSTNTSTTPSPTVNTQHLSNYYPPSDVSSGYLSASSTTGDANSYL